MSLISSNYKPPTWARGKHMQTILPFFRKVKGVSYQRERIATFDYDFLDLDWSKVGSSRLVILTHGVEGNSSQSYILGMVKMINKEGWDALAWNFRSCSGEINNHLGLYDAASTEDLKWVIKHALKGGAYKEIVLIGFSLGGCYTLQLLGELGKNTPSEISKALTFSVPCDLQPCIKELSYGINKVIYLKRFIWSLKEKLELKKKQFPDLLSHLDLNKIQNFEDFDNVFTAPLRGFKNANNYYEFCSCRKNIPEIHVPTLIVNAQNDPFLPTPCQPIQECKHHVWVHLEMPSDGGHLGFMLESINGRYFSEQRALEFLRA